MVANLTVLFIEILRDIGRRINKITFFINRYEL